MACQNNQGCAAAPATSCGSGYLIIIVLYILLAIILGAAIAY